MADNKKLCYLCGKVRPERAFVKLGYEVKRCPSCGLFRLELDRPYQEFVKDYYQEGYFRGDSRLRAYADYEGDRQIIRKNNAAILGELKKLKKKGRILDVGCAVGFFLEDAKGEGFDPYGIDVSEYATKKAKKRLGDRVQTATLDQAKFADGFFDVICFLDVFEHFAEPVEQLKKARQFLKDDGIILIMTGDVGSAWSRLMGANWHFFAPPQHLFFYSRETLEKMLSKGGFAVTEVKKKGKWVSLRYLFHMMRFVNLGWLGDALSQTLGRTFLGRVPFYWFSGDNMLVFARKR